MFLKGYPLESRNASKNWNQSVHIFWARLASFGHLGLIGDPLIILKFHNELHDQKGQENKIYTIVKCRETIYRRHTVPVTSCSEVKNVLKRVSFGSKDCIKELKLERAVDGAPSQIPTLKFLTHPAPTSPTPGHDSGNRMKILFNMFFIFYLWEHTQRVWYKNP